jgi:peroxiredoxin
MTSVLPGRLRDLEDDFARLAPDIPDGPQKQALSLLHGMVLELWRGVDTHGEDNSSEGNFDEILNLWKTAPAMQGEAVSTGLAVGETAPDFELPDANGNNVKLSDYRGKPVVLAFYPLDWSPGCSQQLDLYQQELEEFERRGAQLLAISVDSVYSHGAWAAVRRIEFPLLADFNPRGDVARRYGVWRDQDGFSERALYVIDPEGKIAYAHVSPYLHHIPEIEELFDAIDNVRTAEKAGVW